jgi:hypothetical protein
MNTTRLLWGAFFAMLLSPIYVSAQYYGDCDMQNIQSENSTWVCRINADCEYLGLCDLCEGQTIYAVCDPEKGPWNICQLWWESSYFCGGLVMCKIIQSGRETYRSTSRCYEN